MISICPRCKNSDFEKLILAGVELDKCKHCQGIWMDEGEYEKIVESLHNTAPGEIQDIGSIEKIREESYLPLRVICPSCGKTILEPQAVRFEFIHHVVITDRCKNCQGVWLDDAELALIFKYMKAEDEKFSKIANREQAELNKELMKGGKRYLDRRTFFRLLFGMPIETN